MKSVIDNIRKDLMSCSSPLVEASSQRYFKETVNCYGVRMPKVHAIAKDNLKQLIGMDKKNIFAICEELFKSGNIEESIVACDFSYSRRKFFVKKDLPVFKKWIDDYITNWATCDTFCNHTVGSLMEQYPECLAELKKWTKSDNRWMKRAAAVSLIVPAKKGKYLKEIFGIAESMLDDKDDMVQKGYGWLLKVASQPHQMEVFDFVMKRKTVMHRTALRYAIEKLPPDLRKRVMER